MMDEKSDSFAQRGHGIPRNEKQNVNNKEKKTEI